MADVYDPMSESYSRKMLEFFAQNCRDYIEAGGGEENKYLLQAPTSTISGNKQTGQIAVMLSFYESMPDSEKALCTVNMADIDKLAEDMAVSQSDVDYYNLGLLLESLFKDGFPPQDIASLGEFMKEFGSLLGQTIRMLSQTLQKDAVQMVKGLAEDFMQDPYELLGENKSAERVGGEKEVGSTSRESKGYSLGSQCAVASEAKDGQELGGSGPSGRDSR